MGSGKKVIRLQGFSESEIWVMEGPDGVFVRKIGQSARNIERMRALSSLGLPVPGILGTFEDGYDMEYLPHLDTRSWLARNHPDALLGWIAGVIERLRAGEDNKDYLDTYRSRLQWLDGSHGRSLGLPFGSQELINRLPRWLPASQYHGDLTMENILCMQDGFVLIDPLTSDYDSWVFDVAKLMVDLDCGWFIRNTSCSIEPKIRAMSQAMRDSFEHAGSPYLAILMLLRVLPYATGKPEHDWILKEIAKLWK